jgi:hypothetical protein
MGINAKVGKQNYLKIQNIFSYHFTLNQLGVQNLQNTTKYFLCHLNFFSPLYMFIFLKPRFKFYVGNVQQY